MNEVDTERSTIELNLIQAITHGDIGALRELYFSYYPRLSRFLAHCATSWDLGGDMIVDIFQTVFHRAQSFRRGRQVSTWILGITNLSVKQVLGTVLPPAEACSVLPSHTDHSDRTPDSTESVVDTLERLPLEQRMTFLLAYQLGLSAKSIETVTRCTPLVVTSRLAAARKVFTLQSVEGCSSAADIGHARERRRQLDLA